MGERFWDRIVTCDECWVQYHTPKTKEESKSWLPKGSKPEMKPRPRPFEKKIMATVFFDSSGILLCDYVPPNETVNAASFCQLLEKLRASIKLRRRGMLTNGVIIHTDNARPHVANSTTAHLHRYRWRVLKQAPYSPDTAPCDYALFSLLKKHIRGTRFESHDHLTSVIDHCLNDISSDWFLKTMKDMERRWTFIIQADGHYFEKMNLIADNVSDASEVCAM